MSFIFREYHAEKNVQKLRTSPTRTRAANVQDLGDFWTTSQKVTLANQNTLEIIDGVFPRGQQGGHWCTHVRGTRNATRQSGWRKGELIWTTKTKILKSIQTKAKFKRHIENIWKIRGKPRTISAEKTGKIRHTHTHLAEGEIAWGKCRAHVKGHAVRLETLTR